jgi:hypothetical protein
MSESSITSLSAPQKPCRWPSAAFFDHHNQKETIMNDYDLGYKHGFNDSGRIGTKKYPHNINYCEGFHDGDWARVYMPTQTEREALSQAIDRLVSGYGELA